jgi:deaminated glutathione amidase
MSTTLRIAAIQLNSTDEVDYNLTKVRTLVKTAKEKGAELAALPECFALMGASDETRRLVAESVSPPGPITKALQALASEYQIAIVAGGMAEHSEDPKRPYNSCVFFDENGIVQRVYRKIHLFDVDVADGQTYRESNSFSAGSTTEVVDFKGFRLGLSVCYDVRFPELYRKLAEQQADVLFVPAAFTLMTGKDHWHVLLRARAIENQCYVVAPAQCGKHANGRMTYGKSLVADPWGEVVAQCSEGVGMVVVDIERATIDRVRTSIPCLQHRRL